MAITLATSSADAGVMFNVPINNEIVRCNNKIIICCTDRSQQVDYKGISAANRFQGVGSYLGPYQLQYNSPHIMFHSPDGKGSPGCSGLYKQS